MPGGRECSGFPLLNLWHSFVGDNHAMNQYVARCLLLAGIFFGTAHAADIAWHREPDGLAMTRFTNAGPVIYSVVRIERDRLGKDFSLLTTLASNQVVGTSPLTNQIAELPAVAGEPVAAMNADFFMMTGAAKGDPRGLHIWRGELVSVPTGPAAFWIDGSGNIHGELVESRLTVSWPGGGTHRAGLNEQLYTNALVLFTPRMGRLNRDRSTTNTARTATSRSSASSRRVVDTRFAAPPPGPIRPPGGREYFLRHAGEGPWLPLRVGQAYRARVVGSSDGFAFVPAGHMALMLGSNLLAQVPPLTNGTLITIQAATDPDLSGIEHALGTGPMLVRAGKVQAVEARLSNQRHPRAAIGWNKSHLFLATVDGRQASISIGITLGALAEFMAELGCDEAINMDGGQSTTLFLNGKIVNQPTRARHNVANGVVILRKPALRDADED